MSARRPHVNPKIGPRRRRGHPRLDGRGARAWSEWGGHLTGGVQMPAGLMRGMCVALLFDAVLAAAVYLTGSAVGLW